MLDQVKDKLGYITETVSFATEYVSKINVINWLVSSAHKFTVTSGQGCHSHGKIIEFLEFWKFLKIWGSSTKIGKGHGKVMEFLNWRKKWWNLTNRFCILMNQRCCTAAFQKQSGMCVYKEIMTEISWPPCLDLVSSLAKVTPWAFYPNNAIFAIPICFSLLLYRAEKYACSSSL